MGGLLHEAQQPGDETDQCYRHAFDALQLVWTDDERHWPWDRGWSNARRQQPVFGARDPERLNSV